MNRFKRTFKEEVAWALQVELNGRKRLVGIGWFTNIHGYFNSGQGTALFFTRSLARLGKKHHDSRSHVKAKVIKVKVIIKEA